MTDHRRRRNLRTRLKRRKRTGCAMQAYDALPRDLRSWLSTACLPWSPNSALKIWKRAGGNSNPDQALSQLQAIEQAMLQRDSGVWSSKA